ncbi:MAG: glycosyltransferase family 4 protein [Lactovum sp.]
MFSTDHTKLKIKMMSSAEKVAGQGVSSAYKELIRLLKKYNKDQIELSFNRYFQVADITHYHTVDFLFYLQSFLGKKIVGRKIGYVHFLPETLDGSIILPLPLFWIFKFYVRLFYRRMDHLVVVNPDFKEKLIQIGVAAENISFIPNFVSKEQFYELDSEEKIKIRKRYKLSNNDFLVLGAGQVQYRKGIDDFVELAKSNPDIQFIWAGGFSFGAITGNYKHYKYLVEHPPKNLLFTGIVDRDEIQKLNNIADIFLLPSYDELFPMSILEAASCGAAIMLRDLKLYHNILAGKYIACQNRQEMELELRKVIHSPEIIQHYRLMSKDIQQNYSEEHLTLIWRDFYKEQANL